MGSCQLSTRPAPRNFALLSPGFLPQLPPLQTRNTPASRCPQARPPAQCVVVAVFQCLKADFPTHPKRLPSTHRPPLFLFPWHITPHRSVSTPALREHSRAGNLAGVAFPCRITFGTSSTNGWFDVLLQPSNHTLVCWRGHVTWFRTVGGVDRPLEVRSIQCVVEWMKVARAQFVRFLNVCIGTSSPGRAEPLIGGSSKVCQPIEWTAQFDLSLYLLGSLAPSTPADGSTPPGLFLWTHSGPTSQVSGVPERCRGPGRQRTVADRSGLPQQEGLRPHQA